MQTYPILPRYQDTCDPMSGGYTIASPSLSPAPDIESWWTFKNILIVVVVVVVVCLILLYFYMRNKPGKKDKHAADDGDGDGDGDQPQMTGKTGKAGKKSMAGKMKLDDIEDMQNRLRRAKPGGAEAQPSVHSQPQSQPQSQPPSVQSQPPSVQSQPPSVQSQAPSQPLDQQPIVSSQQPIVQSQQPSEPSQPMYTQRPDNIEAMFAAVSFGQPIIISYTDTQDRDVVEVTDTADRASELDYMD